MSRSTSTFTGAATSSMNDTAAIVATQPAVATAPTGIGSSPCAGVARLAGVPPHAVAHGREHQ